MEIKTSLLSRVGGLPPFPGGFGVLYRSCQEDLP